MFTIVNDTILTIADLSAVRYGSQGEAEAGIREWLSSDSTSLPLDLDPSGLVGVHSAVCKILDIPRDKTTDHLQVGIVADGKTKYRNVRKSEAVGKRETRTTTTLSYSRDARKAGMATFCEAYGLYFGIDKKVSLTRPDGVKRYGFVRIASVNDSNS